MNVPVLGETVNVEELSEEVGRAKRCECAASKEDDAQLLAPVDERVPQHCLPTEASPLEQIERGAPEVILRLLEEWRARARRRERARSSHNTRREAACARRREQHQQGGVTAHRRRGFLGKCLRLQL